MGDYIFSTTFAFQMFVFILTLYYLVLSMFGFYRKNEKKNYKPNKRFAMIVAAHNEEVVIGNLIDSLQKQDYPKELYDVFVIADNCSDRTAEIARNHGANVFQRSDKEKRGKGYALEWMFDKIFKMDKKYDAVAIFDADNLVCPNFLKEMNSKMCEGYKVVQGYIDSKNPYDSWITQSYSVAFWSANRMFQLARANLGLSNQIGGTGFALDVEVLKKLGWGATCLTEDLEFTCKLVLNGSKVGWAHDAIVYDEKPLTLKESWNQRKRWMQGFTDVSSRFFFKLIRKSFKDKDFVAFDCALYVIQPFVTLLLAVSLVLTLAQNYSEQGLHIYVISYLFLNYVWVWKLFSVFQFLLTPFVMLKDNKLSKKLFTMMAVYSLSVFILPELLQGNKNMLIIAAVNILYTISFFIVTFLLLGKKSYLIFFRYVLLYGFYTLTWIPITVQGILNKNNKEWSHTKHVRQIGIYEV